MDNGESSYLRFLDGDDNGIAQIVDSYYDGLTLYINTFVRNLSVAEDLAEDTLAKIIINKPKFNGKSSFRTWLYSIGRNVTLDYLRHNKIELADNYSLSDIASDEEIQRDFIKDDDNRKLYRAMVRLKSEYRQVLWLTYFEDLDQKTTAGIMHKTVAGVKHLLSRAKDALKSELEKEGYTK